MNLKKLVIPGVIGLTATIGVIGGTLINGTAANAATNTTTTQANSSTTGQPPAPHDPTKGGHIGANGTKEELLTGDTATKVRTAAENAVTGGTVLRVETDAEGATYEAHVKKSDGSEVTVKLDASFKITGTEDGPAHGPRP